MPNQYAENFFEIPTALAANDDLRQLVVSFIKSDPILGKTLEDDSGNRLRVFRDILIELANDRIFLETAYQQTEAKLPRHTSPHKSNSRAFSSGWAERLVRMQLSRFYNQAVLKQLLEAGAANCFVPHSESEKSSSRCTQELAGSQHPVATLYDRLIDNYSKGNYSKEVKIPNHPHCTHVVRPISEND